MRLFVPLLLTLALPFAAEAQTGKVQKWEYLTYGIYFNGEPRPISVTYGHTTKTYTIADFSKITGSKGKDGIYKNASIDMLNYFGSLGWEMVGVYNESVVTYSARLVMYFKRPLK